MTAPTRNSEARIRRAIAAAQATGLTVRMVRLAPDGTVELATDPAPPAAALDSRAPAVAPLRPKAWRTG